jgi:hypothetical protein
MKFALVYAYDPTAVSAEGEVAAWMDLHEDWRAAGITVDEAGFHPSEQGRVVRVRDGATAVEKGTAAPAENTIAGYWVIETADIETATNLAARLPTANYGYVEVRQVVELEG